MSYDQLLTNWDLNPHYFHQFLDVCCGIKGTLLHTYLTTSVTSSDDLENWIENFDGNLNPAALEATTERYKAYREVQQ